MFFSKIEIKNIYIIKFINSLNLLTFSVILIHGRLFPTKNTLTEKFFKEIRNFKGNHFLLIYGISIYTYFSCCLIDYFRLLLFKLLKIKKLCQLIGNKAPMILDKLFKNI